VRKKDASPERCGSKGRSVTSIFTLLGMIWSSVRYRRGELCDGAVFFGARRSLISDGNEGDTGMDGSFVRSSSDATKSDSSEFGFESQKIVA